MIENSVSDDNTSSFRLTPEEVSLSQTLLDDPKGGKVYRGYIVVWDRKLHFAQIWAGFWPLGASCRRGPGARWFSNIVIWCRRNRV